MNISQRSIRNIVENIQIHTRQTQEEIANSIGYKRTYLVEALKKSGTKKLISSLLRYEEVLATSLLTGVGGLITENEHSKNRNAPHLIKTGAELETLIRAKVMNETLLGAVAELLAHQRNSPVARVLQGLQLDVEQRIKEVGN